MPFPVQYSKDRPRPIRVQPSPEMPAVGEPSPPTSASSLGSFPELPFKYPRSTATTAPVANVRDRLGRAENTTSQFLDRTTIHGLYFLSPTNGESWLTRLVWVVIVVGCFSWAVFSINDSFGEWRLHPVETVIGSPVYHVTNVQYPTVSVCEGQNILGRTWGPTARYLNTAEFPCASNVTSECKPSQVWADTFFPLFRRIFNTKMAIEWQRTPERVFRSCSNCSLNLANAIFWSLGNAIEENSSDPILGDIQELVVANLHINISAAQFIGDFLLPHLDKLNITPIEPDCASEINDTCESKMHPVLLSIVHLYDQDRFRLGLGTFLSTFSKLFDHVQDMVPLNDMLTRGFNCLANVTDGPGLSLIDVMLLTSAPNPSDYRVRDGIQGAINASIGVANNTHCNSTGLIELANAWNWIRQGSVRTNLTNADLNPCAANKKDRPYCCGYWNGVFSKYSDLIVRLKQDFKYVGTAGLTPDPGLDASMNRCLAKEGVPTIPIGSRDIVDYQEFRLVPVCIYDQQNCPDFEPMLSVHGMAFSLNGKSEKQIFAQTDNIKYFQQVFHVKDSISIMNNRGSGQAYATLLVFDGHNDNERDVMKFAFSVGSKETPFEVNQDEYQVSAGVRTNIRVSMMQVVSKPEVRSLGFETRDCRFTDEMPMGLNETFQMYTKAGCQLDCVLRLAAQECGCVPWDFPKPRDLSNPNKIDVTVPMCALFGNVCFRQQMSNISRMTSCGCFDNCNVGAFSFTETRDDIDPALRCTDNNDVIFQYLEERSAKSLYGDRLLNRPNWLSVWSSANGSDVLAADVASRNYSACADLLARNMAIVSVEIPSSTLLRTENRLRMTLTEQIGVLGGTLGLFTGMSIISLFEVLFWLKNVIWRVFRG